MLANLGFWQKSYDAAYPDSRLEITKDLACKFIGILIKASVYKVSIE
jgi:hypothetical protein